MPVRVRTGREAGESSGDRCMRRGWRAGKGGKWLDLATVPGSARRGAPHTCLVLPCLVRYLHQLHLLAPWLSGLSPHQYCMRHAVSGRDLTTHAAATHAAAVDPQHRAAWRTAQPGAVDRACHCGAAFTEISLKILMIVLGACGAAGGARNSPVRAEGYQACMGVPSMQTPRSVQPATNLLLNPEELPDVHRDQSKNINDFTGHLASPHPLLPLGFPLS